MKLKQGSDDNKTSLSDLAQVTRLYELGLVSKEQVQKIIAQVCSDNKKGAQLALIYCSGFALIYCSGCFASYFFHLIRSNVSCNLFIFIYTADDAVVVAPPRKRPAERPSEELLVKIEPEDVPSTPKKKKRKSRPGRSSPDTANLRKVVKNATRRRFFEECMNLDSILWSRTEGHKKADMDNLLFSIAAQDVIDELYKENPGTLRSVPETKLRSVVKWHRR